MATRLGPLLSTAGHGGLLIGVLLVLGQPEPFATRPQEAIAVDLVAPEDVPRAQQTTRPSPPDTLAASSPAAAPQPAAAQAGKAETPGAEQPQQQQRARTPQSNPEAASQREAIDTLMGLPLPRPGAVDSDDLLALYNLRPPSAEFDAPASRTANISADDVAQLKTQLRRCWRSPPGMAASSTRVVLRIFLNIDGTLSAEPMLIEASASRDGPQVMQAAMQAVQQCQPFASLPQNRYREWKQLDVSFSPRDMAGG